MKQQSGSRGPKASQGRPSRLRPWLGTRVVAPAAASLIALPFLAALGGAAAPGSAAGASGVSSLGVPHKIQAAPRIPAGAHALGAVPATTSVRGAVVLAPRDNAALTTFIGDVTNPASPDFHHYLAPGEFASRFGPASATVAAVEAQLGASGLVFTNVARDDMVLTFRGSAKAVESAFRTGLERYRLSGGSRVMATTSAVTLPSSIGSSVAAVVGLNTLVHRHPAGPLRAPATARGRTKAALTSRFVHPAGSATACSTATTIATQFGGLTDDQIANAYGAFGLYTHSGTQDFAAGQTIAVYELEPFDPTNIRTFDTCYFGASKAAAMMGRLHSQYTTPGEATFVVDGGQVPGPGVGEAALDIENLSALAPTATIDVYEAPNTTFGNIDEYSAIVNQDKAKIVSTSWGICEQASQLGSPGNQQAENLLFEQAAAQGQSVFSAAGDNGSNDCNTYLTTSPVAPDLSVDDPASQPYVVAVGGTTITNATQPLTATDEHVWNDGVTSTYGDLGAGGGGVSQSWPMPAWQSDVGAPLRTTVSAAEAFQNTSFCVSTHPGASAPPACRELPDVSAQADELTGAITVYFPTTTVFKGTPAFTGWTTFGGTSSAAPIWAALVALANDSGASAVCSGAGGVGFVSPLLYSVASNPAQYAASFTDVTSGTNDVYDDSHLFPARTGYDMASGLGSPELTGADGANGLAYYLCNAGTAPRPVVTKLTPSTGATGTHAATVAVSGTGFCTGATFEVQAVQFGSFQVPASTVKGHSCSGKPNELTVQLPTSKSLASPGDPTGGAGAYPVTVVLKDGKTSIATWKTGASVFTYYDKSGSSKLPAITSVRTDVGPKSGGSTVTVFGTGLSTTKSVSFGGVPGTVKSVSTYKVVVTAPAVAAGTSGTHCAQDGSTFTSSESPTNDICQVPVVVTTAGGSSGTAGASSCKGADGALPILPLYEGSITFNTYGVLVVPSNAEPTPRPCEYDYVPSPAISSISTSPGAFGTTKVTLTGKGLNFAGVESINVAPPGEASFPVPVTSVLRDTGTAISFLLGATTGSATVTGALPLWVSTAGGTTLRIAAGTADATAAVALETSYPATTPSTYATRCIGDTNKTTAAATRPVVLATDQHFEDALSSQYLASSLKTGTLLTPYGQLSAPTLAALKLEGVTNVDIVGGSLAVSTAVLTQLERTPAYACGGTEELQSNGGVRDLVVTRISGPTQYDTAKDVATRVAKTHVGSAAFQGAYGKYDDTSGSSSPAPGSSAPLRTAILANGQEFQDAESASMMSYEEAFPILLTTPTALSAQAQAAIKSLTIGQVVVLGGPFAVADSVVTSLTALGVSVLRIAGTTASDTSTQLAAFELTGTGAGLGWTPQGSLTVARGNGFTDGLAGAVLQVHYGTQPEPLLLTSSQTTPGTALTAFLQEAGTKTGVNGTGKRINLLHVLGGTLAVTPALLTEMQTALRH